MMDDFVIEEELKKMPSNPGVYIMHDNTDEIIYVGKAKKLSNRVKSYFNNSPKSVKTIHMVSHIKWFEYILTDNEDEALTLECNLIKEHRPKYNIMLMDDKEYPYIKVTTQEDYPRIILARRMDKDYNKNKYFGPYVSNTSVKEVIDLLKKVYKLRDCNKKVPFKNKNDRPCLNYHLGLCDAPCINNITMNDYNVNVKKAIEFLDGKYEDIINILKEKMNASSEKLDYEQAGKYKELIDSIKKISSKQKITNTNEKNIDIVGLARDDKSCVVEIFFIRNGKMNGRDSLYINAEEEDTNRDIIEGFIKQFYISSPFVPSEIYTPCEIEDRELIENNLLLRTNKKVHIVTPKKGQKSKLVDLASENAKLILNKDKEYLELEAKRTTGAIKEIENILGINNVNRIESYDISNISGENSVGSMVVYEQGRKKKNDYRKFNIKNVKGANDYKSLEEVLTRRFNRYKDEMNNNTNTSFSIIPDLILMDGGKGQVNIAIRVLKEHGLNINVAGLVKDDKHRTRGIYYNNREYVLDSHSEGFKLITRIQDETHRFAITSHRNRRGKEQVSSVLDDIKGVGEKRRKILRKHFITIDAIKNASLEDLCLVPGIPNDIAKNIYNYFH